MMIIPHAQGSEAWRQARAAAFTASEVSAAIGASLYTTRAQLLREKHTGVVADVDIATQKRFDNGHRVEALARPLAEEFIGAELFPITAQIEAPGIGRPLLASFDGMTLDETTAFEHKALGPELRAAFDSGAAEDPSLLPLHYRAQMEQQCIVGGCERVLFMTSAWTPDDELIEERHCWYYPDATLRQQILAGWAQFEKDLAAYTLPAAAEPAPVGRAPEQLPALRIEVTGAVTASNLAEFKATALGAIRSVNRDLKTDQDVADAEKAVKWCADVESRIKAAKEHALSQTASIDALFKTLDDIATEARTVRLDVDKLVSRRKTEVKEEAVLRARRALDAHIATLNAEIAPMRLPAIAADFAGCIKGLKSLSSINDKLDGLLATAKIAADADARAIRDNVAAFKAQAAGLEFLFADLGQIVHKAADDFAALVTARISTHRAAEAARIAAEAKRLADEQIARREAEDNTARAAAAAATAPAPDPATAPAVAPLPAAAAPAAGEPAALSLGAIAARLGFTVSAQFVSDVLGVHPARTEKAGRYYTGRQFSLICRGIASHVVAIAQQHAAEKACA